MDTFLNRSKLLNDKLGQAKADKVKLEDKLEAEQVRIKGRSSIIPAVKRVIAVYRDLQTAEDKNKLLKEVLEKAVYTKEISGRWHAKPDDFKLVLYPKLPR